MTDDQLLARLQEKLRRARVGSREDRIKSVRRTEQRLAAARAVNDDWNATLAVVAVSQRDPSGHVRAFKCLVPAFGRPSGAAVIVSRDRLVEELRKSHRIVTAVDEHDNWIRGADVTLTPSGYLTVDAGRDNEDDLGGLPVESRLEFRR